MVMEGYEQMEDAHFWVAEDDYSDTAAIDDRAVYGYTRLGGRVGDDIDVPVRNAKRDVVTAIRTVSPGDKVRVNDGSWMDVVRRDDEGFVAVPENGSAERVVQPTNPSDRPPGTFHSPWMRRVDGYVSEGEVCCLEVDWSVSE